MNPKPHVFEQTNQPISLFKCIRCGVYKLGFPDKVIRPDWSLASENCDDEIIHAVQET